MIAVILAVAAILVSVVSLLISGLTMRHVRRQADAGEESNWLAQEPAFDVELVDPNSNTLKLRGYLQERTVARFGEA